MLVGITDPLEIEVAVNVTPRIRQSAGLIADEVDDHAVEGVAIGNSAALILAGVHRFRSPERDGPWLPQRVVRAVGRAMLWTVKGAVRPAAGCMGARRKAAMGRSP